MDASARAGTEVLAVGGKGGTGKTTIVAVMAKILSSAGARLLAVDADPPVSLTYALGAEPRKTLGSLRTRLIEDPRERREIGDTHIRDVIADEAVMGLDRMDLLVLGQAEGPGCYCGLNELLKFGIDALAKKYEVTLIDCEAGIEQINRRVINAVHTLIMVSDATVKGLRTAAYLKNIARDYGVEGDYRTGLIINRVGNNADGLVERARDMDLDLLGMIPADELVARYDLTGRPTFDLPDDAPCVVAVRDILKKLGMVA